ncbi:MAG TPA: HAMP domain-containing sensor histidine kinase [Gemmatimonadaceae bacterium]|nr:HAMP domain-containing sensor histidine kinase [Gemmatimonadaceae bacterium]
MSPVTRVPLARPGATGDRRGWIVSAALFAPLVLLLVVALLTWRAERQYAAVTHRVVHDYAGIAAWQYARRANMALHDDIMSAFTGIASGHQRTAHLAELQRPTSILAGRATRKSVFLDSARFAFTYEAGSRNLETAGGVVDDKTRAMLERRLLDLARTTRSDDEPHRMLFDSAGGASHAIALWTISTSDGPMRAAYGVVADPGVLRERFGKVIRETNLLPSTNAGAKLSETDVAVQLTRRDGGVVFATGLPLGSTAATDSTGLQLGELRTTVDLPPRLANTLLVGGAPKSQLPSIALMIVVASVLTAIGLVQQRRSRELANLRGRFVANVSHELRTPLAQISMFAETLALRRERGGDEGRHFAAIILAEARRLSALVESVLRFSRLESGRDTLSLESVGIAAEIADAVEAFAPIAQAADVTISLDVRQDLYAHVDRAAFRQVMLNLLDNAVKHGGTGASVEVNAEQQDGYVRVIVDDSGPGVPIDWRERVFEPFVRAESGSSAGAGIGLAVVRDLVAAHRGMVSIEQSPRGGARFIVMIPSAQQPVSERVEDQVEALT